MLCRFALWTFTTVALFGCGPDQRQCSGTHANFVVTLRLEERPLPADLSVHVIYGGSGVEDYSLAGPATIHEVVFCTPLDSTGSALDASVAAAAGSAGDEPSVVDALRCELWTGGFTTLEVRASELAPWDVNLTPRDHLCTVERKFTLDSPDGG